MTTCTPQTTVGELVAANPRRSRVFEKLGIDYCCGGKTPLADACAARNLDPDAVLHMLDAPTSGTGGAPGSTPGGADAGNTVDPAAMTMTELCHHIVSTHHFYLKQELPRLDDMTAKVAIRHGEHDPRLSEVREVFVAFRDELMNHMAKEERILFPLIRQLENGEGATAFHCGSIANPIAQMEAEHAAAGDALGRFRTLTDDYTPPDYACNTYRALLDALATLEADMHQHVHKENNVLFPRAIQQEHKQ